VLNYKERGQQMVATGSLLATLNLRVILSMVSGETTVGVGMLMEDVDFMSLVRKANTIEELTDWVNENY
jgi:hypothetical protein